MNELDTAFYSKLTGGTALTALLAGAASVYNQVVPVGAAMPYVVFNIQAGGPENITPARFENIIYLVKAVSATSALAAGSIDSQIDILLHRSSLTVTGWSNFWLAREERIQFVETAPEGQYIWHVGGTYRVRLVQS